MTLLKQQPPPNPKPLRLHPGPCHRHPDSPATTGLCPSCLRERLSLLNPTSGEASTSTSAPPELRRCKTFSAKNGGTLLGSAALEPRRRSCDVRGRSSLSNLFDLDDDDNGGLRVESRNLGLLGKATCPVLEEEEVESNGEFEIARVSDFRNGVEDDELEESKTTMKEFIDLEFEKKNAKHISNNNNRRDFKEIAGSFWVAASVFSKKLRKWKKTQRSREPKYECDYEGVGLGEMQLERLRGRRLSKLKAQSEVGDYGFGRRSCDSDPRGFGSIDLGRASVDGFGFGRMSCDTDPRFSVDLGRASVDCGVISGEDPRRCSFDAPRASWDGYLAGGGPPRPVVSVIENAMATVYGFDHHRMLAGIKTTRVDTQTTRFESFDQHRMLAGVKTTRLDGTKETQTTRFEPFDQQRMLSGVKTTRLHGNEDAQTTRFESFDRSSSYHHRKETLEKPSPNPRVSPAAAAVKLLITEKELNEWRLNSNSNSNSLKDDNSSESFETASKDLTSVSSSSSAAKDLKKCRNWSKLWSFWGLLKPRKGDDKYVPNSKDNPLECPRASSAENYIRNGLETGFDPDWKLPRSLSTASSRKAEPNSNSNSNSKALVLDRNRSARYSPNHHLDNGLLRFYLTPLRSRSRRRSKVAKGRLKNSRSLARSVLRL